jgi:D-glycero-D-manno-heptose 1,7-bisphosphate phosphatase
VRSRRLVLLDRDGTIVIERNYLADPQAVELLPNAAAGIRRLNGLGLPVAVVTNQAAVARGLLSHETLERIHARLRLVLAAEGARVDGIFFCPHAPEDSCRCRKPASGLLEKAARELGGNLSRSFLVGDKASDIGAGRAAGCRTLLVKTGYGAAQTFAGGEEPDAVVEDLLAAAEAIAKELT